FQVPSPIGWKHALRHVTMKAAVGPVRNAADVSVLHRIEVSVINMPLEIRVVTDCMLPVSALPNSFFALDNLARRSRPCVETARETALDQIPACREVSIPGR